jgi:hypothetical protein
MSGQTIFDGSKFTRKDEAAESQKAAKERLAKASLANVNSVAALRELLKDLAQAVGVKIGE